MARVRLTTAKSLKKIIVNTDMVIFYDELSNGNTLIALSAGVPGNTAGIEVVERYERIDNLIREAERA